MANWHPLMPPKVIAARATVTEIDAAIKSTHAHLLKAEAHRDRTATSGDHIWRRKTDASAALIRKRLKHLLDARDLCKRP